MVNVAIIGAGYIGKIHGAVLQKFTDRASVSAVFDSIPDKGSFVLWYTRNLFPTFQIIGVLK